MEQLNKFSVNCYFSLLTSIFVFIVVSLYVHHIISDKIFYMVRTLILPISYRTLYIYSYTSIYAYIFSQWYCLCSDGKCVILLDSYQTEVTFQRILLKSCYGPFDTSWWLMLHTYIAKMSFVWPWIRRNVFSEIKLNILYIYIILWMNAIAAWTENFSKTMISNSYTQAKNDENKLQ